MLKASNYVSPNDERVVAAAGNWTAIKSITANAEAVSETIDGLEPGIYKVFTNISSTISGTDAYMQLNGDSSKSYYARSVWGSTSNTAGGDSRTQNGVSLAPPSWTTPSRYTAEMTINATDDSYVNVSTVYSRAEFTSGGHSAASTAWEGGPLQKLTFVSSIPVTGTIDVYKWAEIKATELHTRELVLDVNVTGEFSYDIDVSGDDILWIEYDAGASANATAGIKARINGITDSVYNRSFSNQNTGTGGDAGTYMKLSFAGETVAGEATIFPRYTGIENLVATVRGQRKNKTSGREFLISAMSVTSLTSDAHTLTLYNDTSDGYDLLTSGFVRVYRQAKTHLLDTAINKVETETQLADVTTWDGKVAMALDTKDMFVYDDGTGSWIGARGSKQQANIYGWQLVASGDELKTAATADQIDVGGRDVLVKIRKSDATAGMHDVRVQVNDMASGADYYYQTVAYASTSPVPSARRSNINDGFSFVSHDFSNGHIGAYEMLIKQNGDKAVMSGFGTSYIGDQPNPIQTSGDVATLSLDSIKVCNSGNDTPADWEVYVWTRLDLQGNGTETISASANVVAAQDQYVIADVSTNTITITLPASPVLGAEVTALDATNSASTNAITIDPGASTIDGVAGTKQYSVDGVEARLKFVGGTVGWKEL